MHLVYTTMISALVLTRPRRAAILATILLLIGATIASAHDMFVQPERFFVEENREVLVRVLNGTFSKSENAIARARLRDISVVSPTGHIRVDTSEWNVAGDTSTFRVRTGGPGTYVLAASTRPSVIALAAHDFNQYLRDDGVPDILAARRRDGQLERPARERYSKHVKALLQVGGVRTAHFATELGYPAELVPLENPYSLRPGSPFSVRTLVEGRPVASQYVLYGGRTPNGGRIAPRSARSDSAGVARIALRGRGTWYVKFIHMAPVAGDTVDYESKWATLTFQVR